MIIIITISKIAIVNNNNIMKKISENKNNTFINNIYNDKDVSNNCK